MPRTSFFDVGILEKFEALRAYYGLTYKKMAKKLIVSPSTLYRWRRGQAGRDITSYLDAVITEDFIDVFTDIMRYFVIGKTDSGLVGMLGKKIGGRVGEKAYLQGFPILISDYRVMKEKAVKRKHIKEINKWFSRNRVINLPEVYERMNNLQKELKL